MLIPNAQITTHMWLQLPVKVRLHLKDLFNIPRSAGTQIEDNRVISDGYTHADLAHITVEKMQQYLMTDEQDIFVLFNSVVGTIVDEDNAPKVPFENIPPKLGVQDDTPPVGKPAPVSSEPVVIVEVDGVRFYPTPETVQRIINVLNSKEPGPQAKAPVKAPAKKRVTKKAKK